MPVIQNYMLHYGGPWGLIDTIPTTNYCQLLRLDFAHPFLCRTALHVGESQREQPLSSLSLY